MIVACRRTRLNDLRICNIRCKLNLDTKSFNNKLINFDNKREFSNKNYRSGPHIIQDLELEKRNIDFTLNLGYNDYYKDLGAKRFSFWNKVKFFIYARSYRSIFSSKYSSLLLGIQDMNYEVLEQICDPLLLKRLAAEMYQINRVEKCKFEIKNPNDKVDVKIINYRKILIPHLAKDDSQEDFKLIQRDKETWEFQHRHKFDDKIEEIEIRLKAHKLYMLDEEEVKGQGMNTEPIVISEDVRKSKLKMMIETKERETFNNLSTAKSEYNKLVMKHFQIEYNLIKDHSPFKLIKEKDYFNKKYQNMKETSVEFTEKEKMNLNQSMKDKLAVNNELYNNERYYTFLEYFDKCKKRTDPYLFCKYFMPDFYDKFIKINKSALNKIESTINMEKELSLTSNPSLELVKEQLARAEIEKKKGLFYKIRNFIFNIKAKSHNGKKVEIYDVVVCSRKRIDIVTAGNEQYLTKFCDYAEKALQLMSVDDNTPQSAVKEEESVYKFFKDPRIVDILLPDFQQIHLLRFEKMDAKGSKFTLTDIDLSLGGNIHISRYV